MIRKAAISTITFDRLAPYSSSSRYSGGMKIFVDNKDNIYLQPVDCYAKEGKHFAALPKEHIDELIELLNDLRNK